MPDATLRIKNLSISLEALSRINNEGSGDLYVAIETLLKGEIDEAHKEQNPLKKVYATTTTSDDDIPF
jgi:hypothetical protein